MSNFPTLTSMGVTSFDQISRYTLHSDSGEEVLKIYYQRPDECSLPRAKKFQFATHDNAGLSSVSVLTEAVSELNALTGNGFDSDHKRTQLVTELDQLEQVMLAKMGELRRRLEHWKR